LSIARQKVGYHLKELEKQGLVELVEERKSGNCVERIVRATSRAYLVSAEALGSLAQGALEATDRFSAAYVVAIASRAISELANMRRAADDFNQTIVMVTHEPSAASRADRVLFLADGRIVDQMERPTPESILDHMKTLGAGART